MLKTKQKEKNFSKFVILQKKQIFNYFNILNEFDISNFRDQVITLEFKTTGHCENQLLLIDEVEFYKN